MPSLKSLLAVLLLASAAVSAAAQTPFMFSCKEDDQIATTTRSEIDSRAMLFTQTLISGDTGIAYQMFTKTAQQEDPQSKFMTAVDLIRKQFSPKNVRIEKTLEVAFTGKSPGTVTCGRDLTKTDEMTTVAATGNSDQAYVSLAADMVNNGLAITVWLVKEGTEWEINSFWLNVSTLVDKDSHALWEMAREQVAQKHLFNAALLYSAAAQLCNRGPAFHMQLMQSIVQDANQISLPKEISGQPPFEWHSGTTTFSVKQVGPIAVGGKIYLEIAHTVSPWQSDTQVDGWNKNLIQYFKKQFPEYSSVFAGIVVRAYERGGSRGYGTVDEDKASK